MFFCVQATHEDEDESVRECEERIRAVLGEKHDVLYQKILQLVMADGAYCEGRWWKLCVRLESSVITQLRSRKTQVRFSMRCLL